MQGIKYSIIIPHYNIPDLLIRCLDCIPVREDIQVIVVDDCSPDNDKYLGQYKELSRPYLEYYSTPKGGSAGRARNIGLEHAKGKWLIFADADDFFVSDFAQIIDAHFEEEAEILYFFSRDDIQDGFGGTSSRSLYFNDLIYKSLNANNDSLLRYEHVVPWAKMIKRDFVQSNKIQFEATRYSNDVLFSVTCGCRAHKVKAIETCLYVVSSRSGSLAVKSHIPDEEYICRTNVAIRAQQEIQKSGQSYSFVSGAMKRLLLENSLLFIYYWQQLSKEGISRKVVYCSLNQHPNRRVRLRLYLLVLFSMFSPFPILARFVNHNS